ncbi:protein kinase domain-containing protein [Streptomyces boluensis]|uniref:Protein kinase n=1 Tax=Streptomyces boluensis TaxID=1775135 RepID=A0A964XPC1_9ACTN|nr:protein kinase [Streptomyces boluensis]NBE54637.1 protein kinase [Streptomyces boluensis]
MAGQGPYALPQHVETLLEPSRRRLVVDRRGSTVWDVRTPRGRLAVKLGHPTRKHPWTAVAPAREAVILHRLTASVRYGEWDLGMWSAQPWHEGESLFDRWQDERHHTHPGPPRLADAYACALALTELHERGWAHGDVQPNHFLVGPGRTRLIDLALAHGGEIPGAYDFPYRGCLVHYEAPEISRDILGTGTATPTPEADVYALGASLFISATGWRHVDYPDDAPREEQRQAVVNKPHRSINVPGPLGPLIEHMMSRNPTDRPSAADICRELGGSP